MLCPVPGASQSTAAGMLSGAATITARGARGLDTALLTHDAVSALSLQHGSFNDDTATTNHPKHRSLRGWILATGPNKVPASVGSTGMKFDAKTPHAGPLGHEEAGCQEGA
ncbi:hypothetical protein BKA56DRAFT_612952 [Ilyonectria sp. MPI-CAGE-AT-0026]|nr:hypothetical protein BKA56DRAFT_612952 [Ilyonectria sp. MPI-CAGE-AT-0026]